MRNYKEIPETIVSKHLISVTCDFCNKTYDDIMEIQEFHHISFVGGCGSVFGDGNKVKCDICQHCLKKLIEGKYRSLDAY